MRSSWGQARWAVETENGTAIEIETSAGQTWALRALVAAGEHGFRPAADKRERWSTMTARLRDLGVPVIDLPSDAGGMPGYRLCGEVQRVT